MKKQKKKWLFRVFAVLFALLLAGLTAASVLMIHIALHAPKINILDAAPKGYRSSVLDESGNVVLTLSGESSNRVYVKLGETPEDLQHAFVAIEDERFYTHHGIDPRGIARAFVKGVREGSFSEGASTITQQLLKNNVFTTWTEEHSFADKLERKLEEQYLAVVLERKVSKDWILENYLNTINLGGGNWGVETAAKYYFDKDVSDLTLSECSVLAAVTKNPTSYNPLKNPEKNAARRKLVLSKMLSLGFITEEEQKEALADPVYERIAAVSGTVRTQEIMTYFEDALIYEVLGDLMEEKGITEEDAWNLLYKGGLTICSTENPARQAICEETAASDELYPDGSEVSMVMIDNETGQVRAMVGGRGEKNASLIFNRAISSKRQPGSTIKVIGEYASALENRDITLGSIYDDAPYTYSDGTSVSNAGGGYAGRMTVRSAIVQSNNIVALKIFQDAGMDNVWAQLQKFGISTLTEADKVEALALGGTSGGVTNLELTSAYSAIARGGEYREPVYYTQVLDRDGNVLLKKSQRTVRAVHESTAELLTDALQDVVTAGTGTAADFEGMPLAGKSGTTTDIRDAWFVGYSPYYTCGIWGGYDDNSAQESSKYVQTVWKTVMSSAHENLSETSLNDAEDKKMCYICTKCGNLAVEGLCDVTEQGDMTAKEYYIPGTEPTKKCTCHEAVEICTESGERAGTHCSHTETRVYLKEGTEETDDAGFVMPASLSGSATCSQHRHFWSGWFGGDGNTGGDQNGNQNGSGNGGFTWPGQGLFGGTDDEDLPGIEEGEEITDPGAGDGQWEDVNPEGYDSGQFGDDDSWNQEEDDSWSEGDGENVSPDSGTDGENGGLWDWLFGRSG